jgi:hypothetical protein
MLNYVHILHSSLQDYMDFTFTKLEILRGEGCKGACEHFSLDLRRSMVVNPDEPGERHTE